MLRSLVSKTFAAVLTTLVVLLALALLVNPPSVPFFNSPSLQALAAGHTPTPVVVAQVDGPLVPPPLRTRTGLPARPVLTPTATLAATVTASVSTSVTTSVTAPLTPTATAPLLPAPTATTRSAITQAATTPAATTTATAPGLLLLPTVTPTPDAASSIPATSTEDVALPTPTATVTSTVTLTSAAELPRLLIQPPAALMAGYRAQGSYSSQTVYADGQIAQQQGTFAIIQARADNEYGSNQSFALTSRTADGQTDSIAVFLVDGYIAVNYNDGSTPNAANAGTNNAGGSGDWVVVQRSAGSSLVKAIRPITDLAALLPQLRGRTGTVESAEIDGQPALHLRLDDPTWIGDRLIRPLLGTSGDIRSFKLDAWLVEPPGNDGDRVDGERGIGTLSLDDFDPNSYVTRYAFQVEVEGARVLDANFDEVRADQAVAWTYQVVEVDDALEVNWPAAAPQPGVIEVPGFAAGAFPLPDNAEWIGLANDVPEVIAPQSQADVAAFYRDLLTTQGWTVSGSDALLRCTKNADVFQLLLMEDDATGGTRISVLAGAALGLEAGTEASPTVPAVTTPAVTTPAVTP